MCMGIKMKVSVAMTTYNGEKYVEEQLMSLLKQTYKIDEVIILDDQSKDATKEIVENFIKKNQLDNWKFMVNKINVGFIKNFLECIKMTSGDIIFLCDQDDIWEADKIEVMSSLMNEKEEILALNSSVTPVNSDGKKIDFIEKKGYTNGNIIKKWIKPGDLVSFDFAYLAADNISPGCTMCFMKEIKERLIECEEMCLEHNFPHDWAINLIASLEGGTFYLNKPTINYRLHENNTLGLKLEAQKGEIRVTDEMMWKREKIAKQIFHLRKFSYDLMKKYGNMKNSNVERNFKCASDRLVFLEDLKFKNYVKILKYGMLYKKMVGKKGMLIDLCCAFKLEKILHQ